MAAFHDLLQSSDLPQAEECSKAKKVRYVNNARGTTGFDLAEAVLPNSSARASQSDVAQKEYNANPAALSYVNAAENKHKGIAKGHSPSRVTTQTMN